MNKLAMASNPKTSYARTWLVVNLFRFVELLVSYGIVSSLFGYCTSWPDALPMPANLFLAPLKRRVAQNP